MIIDKEFLDAEIEKSTREIRIAERTIDTLRGQITAYKHLIEKDTRVVIEREQDIKVIVETQQEYKKATGPRYTKKPKSKTGYHGVTTTSSGKFGARVSFIDNSDITAIDYSSKWLGSFETALEAAKAYNDFVNSKGLDHLPLNNV